MLLSAVSVLVVEQSSSEIPVGLMNKPCILSTVINVVTRLQAGLSRNLGSNPTSGKRFAFSKASTPTLGPASFAA